MRILLTAVLLTLVATLLPTGLPAGLPTAASASGPGDATVSGSVLGEGGELTMTHTTVRVEHKVDGEWRWVGLDGGTAFTDRWTGRYVLTVPAGSYRMTFEQMDHVTYVVRVTLAAGEQRTLDVVLDRGAAITGRVVLPPDGPLANAFVRVYERQHSGQSWSWQQVDYAFVEPSGAYSASGFPGGTYRVGVHPFSDPNRSDQPDPTPYQDEYYDNVASIEDARSFKVDDQGTVTGIDFDLGTAPARAVTTSKQPHLKGKPRVGKRLKVALGKVSPATAKVRYKWFAGKKRINQAKGSTLRVTRRMAGRRIRVKVVARAPQHIRTVVTLRTARRIRR